MSDVPICPYCHNPAALVDSAVIYGTSYGMIWDCRPCDAYVGTHKNSLDHRPLGTMANRELRQWRNKAHRAFDPLWQTGKMRRPEAYQMLQDLMGLDNSTGHIAMFTVAQCRQLIQMIAKTQEDA